MLSRLGPSPLYIARESCIRRMWTGHGSDHGDPSRCAESVRTERETLDRIFGLCIVIENACSTLSRAIMRPSSEERLIHFICIPFFTW